VSRVPVGDLARSGAVNSLVALGTLDQGLRLQLGSTALVSHVVATTTVGARGSARVLEVLLQLFRSLNQSGHRIAGDHTSTGSRTSHESLVSSLLDIVESSLDTIKFLETNISLLSLLEVSLGLLDDVGLLQSLVGLLLGSTSRSRLKGQSGKSIVGVGESTGIGVSNLNKGLEVVKSIVSLVGGVVDVSEGRVVLDIDRFAGQGLLQVIVAQLESGLIMVK
jgi:hypothetical protein